MLNGLYQPGGGSKQFPASLKLDGLGRLHSAEAEIKNLAFDTIEISPRIGNSRRYLSFPNGASFETDDNDTIDLWIRQHTHSGARSNWIHRLESTVKYVALAAVLTVVIGYLFISRGLPWLSEIAANALPVSVAESIGEKTLVLLDEHLFGDSELSEDRYESLAAQFATLVLTGSEFSYRLELRNGKAIGANALALPDGTVIFTDELVELAANDEELAAVMLHEIAHVEYRHGLRQAIHKAGLTTILVLVVGDVSSASTLLTALPALLVETSYSRDMETAADLYAVQQMIDREMDPTPLLTRLQRLEQQGSDDTEPGDEGLLGYLSTHPLGEKRLQPLREAIAN